jgi:hypothetical protein
MDCLCLASDPFRRQPGGFLQQDRFAAAGIAAKAVVPVKRSAKEDRGVAKVAGSHGSEWMNYPW